MRTERNRSPRLHLLGFYHAWNNLGRSLMCVYLGDGDVMCNYSNQLTCGRMWACAGTGVSTFCVHPGIVSTNLARDFEGSMALHCFHWVWSCVNGRLMTPLEGARTTLYCCLEPSISSISGRYYRSVFTCTEYRCGLL